MEDLKFDVTYLRVFKWSLRDWSDPLFKSSKVVKWLDYALDLQNYKKRSALVRTTYFIRRLEKRRLSVVKRFALKCIPTIHFPDTNNKTYFMKHLSYRYANEVGEWKRSPGYKKNWREFYLLNPSSILDSYGGQDNVVDKKGKTKKKKSNREKRKTIQDCVVEYFSNGGTLKKCIKYVKEEFPNSSDKTIMVYFYKLKKTYNIKEKGNFLKIVGEK